jgi:small subunit ribosomal protein S8
MTMTDTISDMLTRIRNALMVQKSEVVLPYSNFKYSLAKVLQTEGWISNVETKEVDGMKNLVLSLKYDSKGQPVISGIKRISKPGQRIYSGRAEIPRVMGGMGTTIISTSKGLMTDKEARKHKVGGEIVCQVC